VGLLGLTSNSAIELPRKVGENEATLLYLMYGVESFNIDSYQLRFRHPWPRFSVGAAS